MRTTSGLSIVVRRSPCLTACVSGFTAGAAFALYLVASSLAGPVAGCAASFIAVVLLGIRWHAQARRRPRWFGLAADGSLRWVDQSGRCRSGVVVAASRVGGFWVTLSLRPSDAPQNPCGPSPVALVSPMRKHAFQRVGALGSRLTHGFASRCVSRAGHAWLITADALERDTFRMLAARVRRLDGG